MSRSASPRGRGEGRGGGRSGAAVPDHASALPIEAGAVTLAAVTGAHGVAGEVRLKVFAEDLRSYRMFNRDTLTLTALRETPQGAIARFAEVADRTAAEALRGVALTVPRTMLPPLAEDEYYHADLIGLAAVTAAGMAIGQVVAVENYGAGDVIEIKQPDGRRFMVPMRSEAVPEWNGERLVVAAEWIDA